MTRRWPPLALVLCAVAAACSTGSTGASGTSARSSSTSAPPPSSTSAPGPPSSNPPSSNPGASAPPSSAPASSTPASSSPALAAASTADRPTTTAAAPLLADLAAEPAGLGRQLTEALRTIRDPAASAAAVEAAGRRQQLLLRRLAAHPDWQAGALAAAGDDVRAFAANDLVALNAPGDPALAKPIPSLDALPAWTIRSPLPADELLGYYREAQAATGIPWTYLAAINLVETRMGRIVGPSSVGAQGPMQFMPTTWAACCTGDPHADHDAIIGAATYLRRRGGPADMTRAVLGYNPNDAYLAMIDRYVANLTADARLYAGYHAWQVFVATTAGPVRLPEGYAAAAPVPAAAYVAAHPEDRA